MEFKIANKNYTLYFGWDFLDQINRHFGAKMEVEGQEINTNTGGLAFLEVGLASYDPIAVQKAIQAAISTESTKPSVINIRKAIEDKLISNPKEYKDFVDELRDTVKKDKFLQAILTIGDK